LYAARPTSDSVGVYSDWQPTPEQIRHDVGVGSGDDFSDNRHTQFAKLFQQRFRNNQKAVGVRFEGQSLITAKFAATIPRWDMASVSLELQKEANQVFQHPHDVNVYETYISMNPVKVAELRERPAGQGVAITFDPRFARTPLNPEQVRKRTLEMGTISPVVVPINVPNPMEWLRFARVEARRSAAMARPPMSMAQVGIVPR